MTPDMPDMKDAVKDAVKEAIKPLEARLEKTNRLRNLALATAVLCLVAASGSVGYAIKSREALIDQTNINRIVVCATARSTALSFRGPQIASSGRKESHTHYLNRIVGQRATLIVSGHLSCPNIKGFDTFEYLRGKALAEIDRILLRKAPNKARELGIDKSGSVRPTPPPGGIGMVEPTVLSTSGSSVSTGHPGSTAVPTHPATNGNTGVGGGGHPGSHPGGHTNPQPAPESNPAGEPGATGAPGGAGGEGGSGGSGGGGGEQGGSEEAQPGKLLPGVIGPVEEGVCHTVLGKTVCPE